MMTTRTTMLSTTKILRNSRKMSRPTAWQLRGSLVCLTRKVRRRRAMCLHEHLPEVAGLDDTLRRRQLHGDRQFQRNWQRPTMILQRRPGRNPSDASHSRFHRGRPRRCMHQGHPQHCKHQGHPRRCMHLDPPILQCRQASLLRDQQRHRSRRCLIRWMPHLHRIRSQLPLPSQQFRCQVQGNVQCVARSLYQTTLSLMLAQTQVGLIKAKATNPCGYSLIRPFAVNLAVETCSSHLGGGKHLGFHLRHHQAPALDCHLAQLMPGHMRIASRVQMEMGAIAKQSDCSMRYKS